MRRNDKQMGEEFALGVIDAAEYGVLGLFRDEVYTIPLSTARDGKNLYFHSAMAGRKVDMIKDGDKVSVSFVSMVNVPNLVTRDEAISDIAKRDFERLDTKAFTTEYESAHVKGSISRVTDDEEVAKALHLIADRFTPDFGDLAEEFIMDSLSITYIYKIVIDEIKGKRNKFDKNGEAMTFGRME